MAFSAAGSALRRAFLTMAVAVCVICSAFLSASVPGWAISLAIFASIFVRSSVMIVSYSSSFARATPSRRSKTAEGAGFGVVTRAVVVTSIVTSTGNAGTWMYWNDLRSRIKSTILNVRLAVVVLAMILPVRFYGC